ncbi:hypothetical protein SUGI_0366510 [Cryptomeria japonica]|nr:hypothetical protein SUGI_0366510 [Cryptomeria japonica]
MHGQREKITFSPPRWSMRFQRRITIMGGGNRLLSVATNHLQQHNRLRNQHRSQWPPLAAQRNLLHGRALEPQQLRAPGL